MGEISVNVQDSTAIVAISSEGKRNAWTRIMRADFVAAITDAKSDAAVRAVVITGGSPDAFCAGQDLDEAIDWRPDDVESEMSELRATYDSVRRCPKPVVAAVNAVAAGSGFQIALCADTIVSHPDARMGQPEVRSGMASAVGARMLQMSVGYARMKEIILGGRLLYGHEAYTYGIANYLVPSESVLATASQVAQRFAAIPADSFAASKIGLAQSFDPEFDRAFADAIHDQQKSQAALRARDIRRTQLTERHASS